MAEILTTAGAERRMKRAPVRAGHRLLGSSEGSRRRAVLLGQLALILLVLLIWQFADELGIATRSALPAPGDVVNRLFEIAVSGSFIGPLGYTLLSWSLGLTIALIVGNVLGVLIGSRNSFIVATRFVVDFFRSVPSVAFVPLAVLLFGSSLEMTLTLIVFGATWDVLIQALYAVRQVDNVAVATLSLYNVGRLDRVRFLGLPSALPFMVTGLRLAAIQALMLTIGAEIIGGARGLGQELVIAQDGGNMPAMYAYIFLIGLLGVAVNAGVLVLRRRLLHWHVDVRSEQRR